MSAADDRRAAAAALAQAALGKAKLPLLVVRRSRRHAGFGLLMGSLIFGFAVAVVWSAVESGDALGGGRIDIGLDVETFAGLTLGQRWMGDPIVKRAGLSPVVTVLAASLDSDARKILEAVRHYWPPEDRS